MRRLSADTTPRAITGLLRSLLQCRRIIEQDPFDDRNWQAAVLDQVIVKLAEPEVFALSILVAPQQMHDLPFADDIADFLVRTRSRAGRFAFGRFAIESAGFHEIFDRLLEGPPTGVQIHIHADARRAIAREAQDLSLRRRSYPDKGRSASASLRRKAPSLRQTRRPRAGAESRRSNDSRSRAAESAREFLRVRGSAADLQSPREYKSSSIAGCRSE